MRRTSPARVRTPATSGSRPTPATKTRRLIPRRRSVLCPTAYSGEGDGPEAMRRPEGKARGARLHAHGQDLGGLARMRDEHGGEKRIARGQADPVALPDGA